MKRVFTKTHRENISKSCKGRIGIWKGKKMPKNSLYKNMQTHIRFKVPLDWLLQFDDIEKLKALLNIYGRYFIAKEKATKQNQLFSQNWIVIILI